MLRNCYPLAFSLFVLGCETKAKEEAADITPIETVRQSTVEEPVWREEWIIGEDPDMNDTIQTSRFYVRAKRLGSVLTVRLDTAPAGTSGRRAHYTPVDSIRVTDLPALVTFTQTCRLTAGAWRPTIALMADTATERWGSPQQAWLLDTVMVRISQIPANSVSCMIELPD